MGKEYFVKITLTATEDNTNFAGETRTYYVGLGTIGYDKDEMDMYYKRGWKRRCFAERYAREKEDEPYWKVTGKEIVEVDNTPL